MQRPAAAGRHQDGAPRILAMFGEMHPRGVGHRFADHLVDRQRAILDRNSELFGNRAKGLTGPAYVETQGSARESVRIEIAENDICVGDGRFRSPLSVAGRTRPRFGGAGPDMQQVERIEIGDRAAARADFDEIDAGQEDRQAASLRGTRGPRHFQMGGPDRMRQALAVVPPTSTATTDGRSRDRAICAAAMTPATGPDSTIRLGNREATTVVAIPPAENIT